MSTSEDARVPFDSDETGETAGTGSTGGHARHAADARETHPAVLTTPVTTLGAESPTTPSPVLRALVALAAASIVVAGLRRFPDSAALTFLALVLVITVHPVQERMVRRGLPRWLAVVTLLGIVYALIIAFVGFLAFSLVQLGNLLPDYSTQFSHLLDELTRALEKAGISQNQITTALHGVSTGTVVSIISQLVSDLATVGSDLLFLLLLLLFLATDAVAFPTLLARATAGRPELIAAMLEFARGTRRFLVVSTVFGVIAAALQVAGLYALHVPLPLLWGLVSLLSTYIANVGFIVSVVPPALLALLQNGPTNALLVIAVYAVTAFVVQSVIQPRYIADAVGLSVTLTFLSLFFWGFVLGGLGALLAVPLSLFVRALLVDGNPRAHWLLPLLAGQLRAPAESATR